MAWITEMIRPLWITKFPNRADRLYELRPCHTTLQRAIFRHLCGGDCIELTQQAGNVAELQDGEVSGERGLFAFLADNTEPHIRSLDHAHIIASITNGSSLLLRVVLDQFNNLCLLSWWATATHDSRGFARNFCKHVAVVVEADLQWVTVDNQATIFLAGEYVQLRVGLLLLFDYKRVDILNVTVRLSR